MKQIIIRSWDLLLTVGLGLELFAVCNGVTEDTLSERIVIRTRAYPILLYMYVGFQVWFLKHITSAKLDENGKVVFDWAGQELLQIWIISALAYLIRRAWRWR